MKTQPVTGFCAKTIGRSLRAGLTLALALLYFLAPAPGEAARKVTLALNWLPGGTHVPFYYALHGGYYKKTNLDVSIVIAQGSHKALDLLQAGKAHFALAEAAELFVHRLRGMDTLGVMVYFQDSPNAVFSLKGSGIRGFRDLKSKKIAAPRASFPRIIFPGLQPQTGLDPAQVLWQNLRPESLLPALISGQVDAVVSSTIAAYQYHEAARLAGKSIAVFPYARAGLNPYSLLLNTKDSLVEKQPELVRDFIRATAEALAAAIEQPRKALSTFLQVNPELGEKRIAAEWSAALALTYPASARHIGLGLFDRKRMENMKALLIQTRKLKIETPISHYFTNDLLPRLRPVPGNL
ncbi:MAG: ABC transporter substrate-binding protein [bacterium]|nr:ABC transporter substrate-binding protein [bacterium]